MKILALETDGTGATAQAFRALARQEASALWELMQADIVREAHFRIDRTDAVLVLECRDLDEAAGHLATLPMVRAGLIRFELIGLRPYPGLARLFAAHTDDGAGPEHSVTPLGRSVDDVTEVEGAARGDGLESDRS